MLLRVVPRDKPYIKLARVGETDSKNTWIFTFTDPIHKFMQSIIFPKTMPAEAMESALEDLYVKWKEQIRETEWKTGRAN